MIDTLKIDGKNYLPAREAGKRFGYSSDYVSRLAREKKILGSKVGRQWLVDPESLEAFTKVAKAQKTVRGDQLSQVRKRERRTEEVALKAQEHHAHVRSRVTAGVPTALLSTAILTACLLVSVVGLYHSSAIMRAIADISFEELAVGTYQLVSRQSVPSLPSEASVAGEFVTSEPEKHISSKSAQGLIVLDSEVSDKELAAIQDTFSDEVTVEIDPNNPDTGLITPVFRERVGDSYRFLLVPVAEE